MSQVSTIYQMGKSEGNTEEKPELHVDNRTLAGEVADGLRRMNEAKERRAAANASIAEVKANLATKGIPPDVVKDVARFLTWDVKRQNEFRTALDVVLRWVTESPQMDLFEDLKPE